MAAEALFYVAVVVVVNDAAAAVVNVASVSIINVDAVVSVATVAS